MNINIDSAKDTLCKNILIYGYCKFENRGCAFSHTTRHKGSGGSSTTTNPASNTPNNAETNTSPSVTGINATTPSSGSSSTTTTSKDTKKKFNFNTPSFQPSVNGLSNKFSNLSPKLDEIPTFVPYNSSNDPGVNSNTNSSAMSDSIGSVSGTAPGSSAIPVPTSNSPAPNSKKFNTSATVFTPSTNYAESSPSIQTSSMSPAGPPPQLNPYSQTPPLSQQPPTVLSTVGAPPLSASTTASITNGVNTPNDLFFLQPTPSATTFPLNYHLYAPAPPPRLQIPLAEHETNPNEMFIPNELRETLTKKNEATLQTIGRSNLPENVNVYHSLVPIDIETTSRVWNVMSGVYKVFSNTDGNPYVLRKIDNEIAINITNELPFRTMKKWKSIDNANIVKLHDSFTSIAFGYPKLVMIYDYYPNSSTLLEQHFNRKIGAKLESVTEDTLWFYIIQITNSLMAIHEKGLAARSSLDLTKIIVTSKNRIKLSGLGISDILNYDIDNAKGLPLSQLIKSLQVEDIKNFGNIMVELALLLVPIHLRQGNLQEKVSNLSSYLSRPLFEVISKLTEEGNNFNLEKFNQIYLSQKLLTMIDSLQNLNDYFENQLTSELENARLFRLISKINFIVDNPTLSWHENDRYYLVKLFNDYIFHQVNDATGKNVVDLSRVLVKLNKLDTGIDETFMLISRDEKVCILVSYKEMRDLIDSIFRELLR